MSTQAQSLPDPPNRVSEARLWFGACAAAAALAVQGFVSFQIAIQACKDGHFGRWGPLSAAGVRGVLGVITAVLLAVAVAGGIISYRNWRAVSEHRHIIDAEGRSREAFMGLVGVFVTVSCVVGIIWAGMPAAFLNTCVTVR
jgi:hypothetical protein